MDNRVGTDYGSWEWGAGQGRAMQENWGNCNKKQFLEKHHAN